MASQKELLSVKGQEKMDKLKDASWDDMGGPELSWSTADYANFKFDAARGVKPDTSILAKASVKAEKGETVKEAAEHDDEEMLDSRKPEAEEPMAEVAHDADMYFEAADEDEEKPADEAEVSPEEDGEEAVAAEGEDDFSFDLKELLGDDSELNTVELGADDMKEAAEDDEMEVEEEKEESESEEGEESEEESEEDEDADEAEESGDEDKEVAKEAMEFSDEEVEHEDDDAEDDEDKKHVEESRLVLSFKFDQADKLFENNSVLTEDDKRQGRVLFEAAIRDVAKQVGSKLNEVYSKKYQQAKTLHEKKVAKQVDQYLSYVVEQWAKDNKVAIRSQIQEKLTENFMKGLKSLFEQHYIDIPKSKVNVVEALAKNVKNLKQQVKASEAHAVKLHTEMKTAVARERQALVREHRARLIAEAAGVLPAAERGQFAKRAEAMTFTNSKNFKKDLVALREQYFGAKPSVERPMNVPDAAPLFEEKPKAAAKTEVDVYAEALGRFTR